MSSKKQLALGAVGFLLLALMAFLGMSMLIGEEDVKLDDPVDPTSLRAGLHVQLLDPEGEPPEDCVVTLWKRVDGRLQTGPKTTGRCVGGDLGWTGLEPGTYLLEAAVPGAARFARNLELSPGQSLELGVAQLSPGGILEVSVVGPDGRGLPGAKIWLGNWLVEANIEGKHRFLGANIGTQVVRAQFDQLVKAATAELEASGDKVELEIVLDELVVRGVLGVGITPEADGIRVTEVVADGPADGVLEVGDLIAIADGFSTRNLSPQVAESALDGPPGEALKMTVVRGDETLELEVVRADLITVLTERMKQQANLPPRMREQK